MMHPWLILPRMTLIQKSSGVFMPTCYRWLFPPDCKYGSTSAQNPPLCQPDETPPLILSYIFQPQPPPHQPHTGYHLFRQVKTYIFLSLGRLFNHPDESPSPLPAGLLDFPHPCPSHSPVSTTQTQLVSQQQGLRGTTPI